MAEVALAHVIGTVMLILVFISAALFYQHYYSSLRVEALSRQLWEAASYIASNVADLVSLCFINPIDQLIIKTLDLPEKIGEEYYSIIIIKPAISDADEEIILVRAYLNSNPYIYGEAILPFAMINVWNGMGGIDLSIIEPKLVVSSSTPNSVIWALARNGTIIIGLGVKIV
ncbi:MAG: hypothetical protein QXH19_05585 [Candidatus Bathyarchaeia archaeon]